MRFDRPRLSGRVLLLAAMGVLLPSPVRALDLAYSFEDGLQGFAPNGLGVSVTQDTIGATDGNHSMKVSVVQGATFVGAATSELLPYIGDPPGLDFVVFDLTIIEMFPVEANFVDIGITVFGLTQPDFPGGQLPVDAQFLNEQVQLQELTVGTHQIRMTLTNTVHPITFESNKSFNDIFGVEGGDVTDVIPTGFQFYINKSADSAWTGYFDNIRVGSIPAPNGGDYNGDGKVDAADYTVWRDNVGSGFEGDGTTTGDLLGVPDGVVDQSDYDYWAQQYGSVIAPPAVSIPEPVGSLMVAAGVVAAALGRRSPATKSNS